MSNKGRDRATQLVSLKASVDSQSKLLLSAHKHEQRKRNNSNRHLQQYERSQLFNGGRDRAVQLV